MRGEGEGDCGGLGIRDRVDSGDGVVGGCAGGCEVKVQGEIVVIGHKAGVEVLMSGMKVVARGVKVECERDERGQVVLKALEFDRVIEKKGLGKVPVREGEALKSAAGRAMVTEEG